MDNQSFSNIITQRAVLCFSRARRHLKMEGYYVWGQPFSSSLRTAARLGFFMFNSEQGKENRRRRRNRLIGENY